MVLACAGPPVLASLRDGFAAQPKNRGLASACPDLTRFGRHDQKEPVRLPRCRSRAPRARTQNTATDGPRSDLIDGYERSAAIARSRILPGYISGEDAERRCLVLAECRAWALEQPVDLQGIWGGLGQRERAKLRRERKAA
jgi:hypothetical protein